MRITARSFVPHVVVKLLQKNVRELDKTQIDLLSLYNPEFSIDNSKFPSGICITCRIVISDILKGKKSSEDLSVMPNYSDIVLTRSTRTDENPICNCFICLTGRDTRQLPASKGRGHVRNLFHEIQKGEGLIGSSQDNRLPPVHQGNKKNP